MILLVIVIILFAWFVLFMKSKIHMFEPFTNLNNKLTNSPHFKNYIKNIHPDMYAVKIKNYKNTNFIRAYISNLRMPKLYEIDILKKYVIICNKIFRENRLTNITKIPWLFLVSKRGLEMNMPYTLSNYIIINETSLENLRDFRQINRNFINTLIHEKIHIIQRINQDKFNTFYKTNFSFIGKKITISEVPLQYRKIYMSNPDSNIDFWLYKINNIDYYPILVKRGAFVKSIAFNKNKKIDLDNFKRQLGYSNNISFYHPNEIFACEVTEMILEKKITNRYFKMLKNIRRL